MKLVIIGAVAAGTSAAAKAKRTNPDADITLINDQEDISYAACGIPYVISGKVKSFENLIARRKEKFEEAGIRVLTKTKAVKIDPNKKIVKAVDLEKGKEFSLEYDSLIIATGARAKKLNIKNSELKGIFTLRTLRDGIKIKEYIENCSKVAVVGAGFIGLEMADAFRSLGLDVTVVEATDQVLPGFIDRDFADIVKKELEEYGIKVMLNSKISRFLGKDSVEGIIVNGEEVKADMVLISIGVEPNSEIARDCGIELGVKNAIRVNERMETNIKGIYACGDCATTKNLITGEEIYFPLGTVANRQGRVAGVNAVNGDASYEGVVKSSVTMIRNTIIGRVGLTLEEALKKGFNAVEKTITTYTKARYYPRSKEIKIKLIADRKSKLVLGAQIIGYEGVKERIDAIAIALQKRASVEDLAKADTCYMPAVAQVHDAINIVANELLKKI